MKVILDRGPAPIISGEMETVDIGISKTREGQLMILNVLSDSLYTDKVSAVLREYSCNAFDAHVESDIGDRPITVRLPNRLDPTVAIRDYGFGMTEPQILQTFCMLGESTKRGSDDYTGMMGIGSKAGFAYGDSFNVTSWAKGIKTIYGCVRLNGRPTLSKMFSEESADPDGVEIKVPVRQEDILEFSTKAERVFRYFKVRPEIQGTNIEFDRKEPEFSGPGWRYVGNGKSVAIMGNVGYDLNSASLGAGVNGFLDLLQAGIELDFNIGDLEVAANREGLQYRDHTRIAVLAKLRHIAKEMGSLFSSKLTAANSEWEAKALFHDLVEASTPNYRYGGNPLQRILTNVQWRGVAITASRISLQMQGTAIGNISPGVNCVQYEKSSSYRRLQKRINPDALHASRQTTLCINDLPKISPSRVNGFFHANPASTRLVIFSFDSGKRQTAYWKTYLEDAPFVLQSSLVPLLSTHTSNGGGNGTPSTHRNKHTRKAFTLQESGTRLSYDAKSMWWEPTTVDYKDGNGVYVWLDAFWIMRPDVFPPPSAKTQGPVEFRSQVVALRGAGLISGPVYGFKRDKKDKLGPKWVPLADAVKAKLDALTTPAFLQNLSDYDAGVTYQEATFIDRKWIKLFASGTPVSDLLNEVLRMLHPPHATVHSVLNLGECRPWLVRPTLLPTPTVFLPDLEDKMLDRYPLLRVLGQRRTSELGATDMGRVADYVRLVDK